MAGVHCSNHHATSRLLPWCTLIFQCPFYRFFIVMSYAWGWLLSAERPDKGTTLVFLSLQQCKEPRIRLTMNLWMSIGDFIGAGVAIGGVLVAWFWPRQTQKRSERLPAAQPQALPQTLPGSASAV